MSLPLAALSVEETACPGCGAHGGATVYEALDVIYRVDSRPFPLVRCGGCDLVYLAVRPTPEAIADAYPAHYFWRLATTEAAPAAGWKARLTALYFRQLYARRAAQVLPLLPPGPVRVLDLGCGGGHFLGALAQARSGRFLGVDFAVGPAPAGVELVTGDLSRLALEEPPFDVVTLWHVLEHLHEPRRALAEACRLVRPGGHVVVATQNFAALSRLLMGREWPLNDVPRHLCHFTPATLAPLVEAAGLTPVRVRHYTEYFPVLGGHLFPRLTVGPDGAIEPVPGLALSMVFAPLEAVAVALGRGCTFNLVARR